MIFCNSSRINAALYSHVDRYKVSFSLKNIFSAPPLVAVAVRLCLVACSSFYRLWWLLFVRFGRSLSGCPAARLTFGLVVNVGLSVVAIYFNIAVWAVAPDLVFYVVVRHPVVLVYVPNFAGLQFIVGFGQGFRDGCGALGGCGDGARLAI